MYIADHHKIQKLGFSKSFQVQSHLNTSSVKEFLVLQEAFKPSQVILELIPALYLKYQKNQTIAAISWIFLKIFSTICVQVKQVMWDLLSFQKPKYAQACLLPLM